MDIIQTCNTRPGNTTARRNKKGGTSNKERREEKREERGLLYCTTKAERTSSLEHP